jgi:glutamine synthetase
VTTRVSGEGGKKARLEHRTADASANPYTAVAAVLQAARLGLENGYELPAAETGDGFEKQDAKNSTGIDLNSAIADLRADTNLCAAVGAKLTDNHIFMKEKEHRKTRDLEGEALRDFYVYFV